MAFASNYCLVPSRVSGIKIAELSHSSANITWNDVGGSISISYNVSVNSTFSGNFEFITNDNFMEFDSLITNTNYTVSIFAYNRGGSGEVSNPITFVTRKNQQLLILSVQT